MAISKRRKRKKEEWVSKDLKSKIPKLDKKTIYIPLQKELPFQSLFDNIVSPANIGAVSHCSVIECFFKHWV
jgi:hypothetical protein